MKNSLMFFLVSLLGSLNPTLSQQLSGYFDNKIGLTIDFSSLNNYRSGNDNAASGKSLWAPSGSSKERTDIGSKTQENEYDEKGLKFYKEAMEHWGKDWDKTIRLLKKAKIWDDNNDIYKKRYEDALAYREWDEGAVLANEKKNWDKAISKFRTALKRFNGSKTLINNIVICSRNKVFEKADEYYQKQDWIAAEVYYGILMKNFGERGWVESRFSEAATQVNKMPKSKLAHLKVKEQQQKLKQELPFVADGW